MFKHVSGLNSGLCGVKHLKKQFISISKHKRFWGILYCSDYCTSSATVVLSPAGEPERCTSTARIMSPRPARGSRRQDGRCGDDDQNRPSKLRCSIARISDAGLRSCMQPRRRELGQAALKALGAGESILNQGTRAHWA